MLDKDLAEMYGVETRVLKQSVKRNDVEGMVSQNVIPSKSEFGGASPFVLQNKVLQCYPAF